MNPGTSISAYRSCDKLRPGPPPELRFILNCLACFQGEGADSPSVKHYALCTSDVFQRERLNDTT